MSIHTTHTGARGRLTPQRVLSFRIGAETYGADILRVREIRAFEAPTRIVGAAPDMLGVINLRGTIVPVLDLRVRLQVGRADTHDTTALIVVDLGGRLAAAVVDAVNDVIDIGAEQLRPVPALPGSVAARDHLLGIASVDDTLLLLVDVDTLMGAQRPTLQ